MNTTLLAKYKILIIKLISEIMLIGVISFDNDIIKLKFKLLEYFLEPMLIYSPNFSGEYKLMKNCPSFPSLRLVTRCFNHNLFYFGDVAVKQDMSDLMQNQSKRNASKYSQNQQFTMIVYRKMNNLLTEDWLVDASKLMPSLTKVIKICSKTLEGLDMIRPSNLLSTDGIVYIDQTHDITVPCVKKNSNNLSPKTLRIDDSVINENHEKLTDSAIFYKRFIFPSKHTSTNSVICKPRINSLDHVLFKAIYGIELSELTLFEFYKHCVSNENERKKMVINDDHYGFINILNSRTKCYKNIDRQFIREAFREMKIVPIGDIEEEEEENHNSLSKNRNKRVSFASSKNHKESNVVMNYEIIEEFCDFRIYDNYLTKESTISLDFDINLTMKILEVYLSNLIIAEEIMDEF